MFNLFSNPITPKKAEAAPLQAAAKPAAPAADLPDIRSAYLHRSELTAAKLKPLFEVPGGPAIVLGFVSPDNPMAEIASSIKGSLPQGAKLLLVSTAGELCRCNANSSLYQPADEHRVGGPGEDLATGPVEEALGIVATVVGQQGAAG